MKRTIPLMIAFFVGTLMSAASFSPALGEMSDMAQKHFRILAAIAYFLGAGNFVQMHFSRIRKNAAGWGYSGVALLAFAITLATGMFKIGAPPREGYYAWLESGNQRVLAEVGPVRDKWTLKLALRGAQPGESVPVRIHETPGGEIAVDEQGRGTLEMAVSRQPTEGEKLTAAQAALLALKDGDAIAVGSQVGVFAAYGGFSGDFEGGDAWFNVICDYTFSPLQAVAFALLAFFVASAAFRAFRARNTEATLLLVTAFIILLGRTAVGTWLTQALPDTGIASFFQIPNLQAWLMSYPFTAGSRAILIGISLGIVATSLKVILGIERSYLGAERS